MSKALYARVAPYDPKRNRTVQNVHCEGTLFRGGLRPIWYKVEKALAKKLRGYEQPTGAPMFEVVDEEEKATRDRTEAARRAVAMGMISETIGETAGPKKQEIDLTVGAGARSAAVPTEEEAPAAAPPPAEAPAPAEGGGNMTTADLQSGPVAAPAPPPSSEE